MFSGNKKLETAGPSKTKRKTEYEIKGIRDLAILDAFIDSLTTMKATLESNVKIAGFSKFLTLTGGPRLTSFVGVEDVGRSSVEMRKRTSRSVLTEEEVEVLEKNGYKVEPTVIQKKLFAVNPEYMNDMALLRRVEKALAKVVPEDFFLVQEEVTAKLVSDEHMTKAFAEGAPAEVFNIISTMALKTTLSPEYDQRNLRDDAMEIAFPTKPAIKPARKAAVK
jgi:hypothetical protein